MNDWVSNNQLNWVLTKPPLYNILLEIYAELTLKFLSMFDIFLMPFLIYIVKYKFVSLIC